MHIDEHYLPDELFAMSELISRYIAGELTQEEQQQLEDWTRRSPENQELFNRLTDKDEIIQRLTRYQESVRRMEAVEAIRLQQLFHQKNHRRRVFLVRMAAAASIVAIAGTLIFFWPGRKQQESTDQGVATVQQQPVPPGQHKARLVLADGSTVLLDPAQHGELAVQGNAQVTNVNGQVVYKATAETNPDQLLFNTVITERGEMYVTVLSDQSKVYLNAQSSLRFPVSFSGKERKVELQGEGYFEVAPGAKPFRVVVNDKTIEVLGTRFCVNAYEDEPVIKTSLLEGKIKISDGNTSKEMKPGQQVRIDEKGQFELINDARVDAAISWTRGTFYFHRESLQAVLRQLARWYVVDVEYHGAVGNETFSGYISREISLQEVLENMEGMAPVKLEVKDKVIHVYPDNSKK